MESPLGIGFAVIAAICLAGQALTVRLATRDTTTAHVLLVVLFVNAIVFLPLAVIIPESHGLTLKAFLAFAVAGIVSTMVGRTFFYGGIKRVGAAQAEPLKSSMPLHATILAVILLGERVAAAQFAGIVLIVGGIAVVSWDGAARDATVTGSIDWIGLAFPLIGAFLFALEPIFATVGLGEGTPIVVGLAVKTTAATVVFFLYLLARGDVPDTEALSVDFRWVFAAGLASCGFMLAYYSGLSVSRVSMVVPIMQTSPLIVAAASAVFLRGLERITPTLIVGSGFVVVGAIVVTLFG